MDALPWCNPFLCMLTAQQMQKRPLTCCLTVNKTLFITVNQYCGSAIHLPRFGVAACCYSWLGTWAP